MKIKRNQAIIGGGILLLLLFLLNKKMRDKKEETTSINENGTKLDLKGIPEDCLDGFQVDGFKYELKDNKFIKTKI